MAIPQPTTAQRGLGWRHEQRRTALLKALVDGQPCYWCGEGMHRWQRLDADHSRARVTGGTLADRLLHSPCNRARGDGSNDHVRPALTKHRAPTEATPSRDW